MVNSSDEHLPFATGASGGRSTAATTVSSAREEQETKALMHQIECECAAASEMAMARPNLTPSFT